MQDFDVDLGVLLQKAGQQAPEHAVVVGRGRDPNEAGDASVGFVQGAVGRLEIANDASGSLVVDATRIRQADAPSGAVKQLVTQLLLEPRDAATDCRCGQIQLLAGCGEAPGGDHLGEDHHVVEIQAHNCWIDNRVLPKRWLVSRWVGAHTRVQCVFNRGVRGC